MTHPLLVTDVATFVADLEAQGIVLTVAGEKLRLSAPKDVLTPEMRDAIKARKDELVTYLSSASPSADPLVVRRTPGDGPADLAVSQERVWFLHQLAPGSAAYHVGGAIRLRGTFVVEAFRDAWNALVRRHESLRTVFPLVQGRPTQQVLPAAPLAIASEDLSALPGSERDVAVERRALAIIGQPFDIERGPIIRLAVLRLGPEEHVVVVAMHHLVADHWSLGLLSAEFTALYAAHLEGRPAALRDLPVRYLDFAVAHRRWLDGPRLQAQLAYWRGQLAGLEMPDLPPDRPRVIAGDAPAGLVRLPFPRDLQDRAQQLASRDRATMFMVLIAAFKIVLSRYTGSTDTSVGTPISNRPTADVEGLVGMFVNTLVFRTDLSGNPTFRELVGRVRATALAGYANQDLSFDRLVSALQPDRSTGRAPFFQVLFNLLVAPKPVRLAGLEFEPIRLPALDAQFDLDVTVSVGGRTPDDDAIALAYNAALFDDATMRRFGGHVLRVLERAIADPDGHIDDIDLLDEAERRQLLVEWNATAAPLDPQETVVSRFQAQARATPDAVAVVCGEASMTYAGLARRADEIARRLAALDLGPERIVGLCVARSADMVAALLGILQAGAAYLPLDPAFPADRLAYMVEDSTATVVLTESALRETVPEAGARVIALDDPSDPFWTTPPAATSPAGPAQADRAYLLYTSGSTGKPKGVEIPHRAFVNFLASMAREPGMSASDRLLAVTTLSFDIAGLELFLPLVTGATVVVATRDQSMDPGALAALIASQRITVMQATPATWRLLLDDEWAGRPELTILCGGEAMTRDLANRLVPRARAVWNLYGPTETTVWSTVERVTMGDEVISVGRPIANTQVYVLDAARRPTPVGVPGELWIGGDGVATGYFRRPDLTAARFVPDPFSTRPGARLYRTGDLARFRADGRLECLGRLDSQVKVRGFRIELGEVESVLAAAPGVRQAVAVVRQDRGEAALAAYLVPAADAIDLDAAREHARQHLAPYMVPTVLVEFADLPLTPNGKVDRKALPAPAPPRTAAVTPPANETEQTIAAVWAEVLGLPAVPVDENFFDLGGHSLLLAQVQRRLDDRLARQVPMLELFQYPTVRMLAARLDRAATTETAVSPAARERMARQRAALERQRTARPLQGDAQ